MIYLSPFGFDERHVISAIVEEGIGDDDTVVLVTPEENLGQDRFEEARHNAEKTLNAICDASIEVFAVNHTDFHGAVLDIAAYLADIDEPVFLNASKGAREVLLAVVVAALFHREKVSGCSIYSDVDSRSMAVDFPFPAQLTEQEERLLAIVEDGMTVGQLAEAAGLSQSTASRRVNRLEEKHVIQTEREGRERIIVLSFTGEIYKTLLG